ncbi:pseudaminic acid cytidylyltransferase [Alteromonas pelagimontana]|uniref:Pseudaminic acid cytidylyltransferase n=1 Tax=Alteromonas pelagimontana TaxID=1858656 RepID=A0A6M4MFT6_9ALTE|nr:pseudaminic acid cytidylyltransferase [Alteromonas pelagimontana]QJR81827.1 pseudaminic acid cytidylyltransferase [Alteromonas pelagimontana]
MRIAVIPARGGSKRIPGKNIRDFAGKPLIAYSLAAAKKSELFDEIIVTTDSQEIADIAQSFGASYIIKRPESLSNDLVGTFPVVQHAISHYQSHVRAVDYVCCIYATAPFLRADKLQEGCSRLSHDLSKHFAFSVTSFAFPIQRAIRLAGEGVEPLDESKMGMRSQDLEECYHDAGQFYWGTTHGWLSNQPMFAPHSVPIILPRYLVQDIDTPEDWQRAELMYRAYVAIP